MRLKRGYQTLDQFWAHIVIQYTVISYRIGSTTCFSFAIFPVNTFQKIEFYIVNIKKNVLVSKFLSFLEV